MTDQPPPPSPNPLNYAGQVASLPSRPFRVRAVFVWLLTALLAIEVITAARIERLNYQAGSILPNRERRDDGSIAKWREQTTSPAQWIRIHASKDATGQPLPLTAAQNVQMQADLAQAQVNNRLRDIVSTWGLAQYLLAPTTLAFALYIWGRSPGHRDKRIFATAAVLISLAAGALALHRAYFPSLGW